MRSTGPTGYRQASSRWLSAKPVAHRWTVRVAAGGSPGRAASDIPPAMNKYLSAGASSK